MHLVALTGSIAMGKSTAGRLIRGLGFPVFDSDQAVARMLGPGGEAVPAVLTAFPDTADGAGGIDKKALGQRVFPDRAALSRLEALLHPRVYRAQGEFLRRHQRAGASLVVLDIPLLFENGSEIAFDAVLVVSAPAFLQRQRVLARPGMTPARLEAVLARQVKDQEKRRRADAVIPTGLGRRVTLRALIHHLGVIRSIPPQKWPPRPGSAAQRWRRR